MKAVLLNDFGETLICIEKTRVISDKDLEVEDDYAWKLATQVADDLLFKFGSELNYLARHEPEQFYILQGE